MHRPLSDEAIAIRKLRFSESSLILWWLTRQHGVVHTLARIRSKTGMGGMPDLFYRAEISWVKGRGSGLAHLREVQVRTVYPGLRKGFARVAAASYFAEAIARAVEHDSPAPDFFDLLEKALGYLDEHEPTRRVVDRFERRLFGSLGLDDGTRPLNLVRATVFDPLPVTYVVLAKALEEGKGGSVGDGDVKKVGG